MRFRWKVAQAAEIRWWQQYLKRKTPATYLDWKEQYWINFLQKSNLSVQPNAQCLDAGCGPAGVFMSLKNQKVTAIDPLLDQYAEKLAVFEQTNYPWVDFHTIAIEQFAPKAQYDYVFCLNAINHVSDWSKSIKKLFEWIKPNGTILLSTDVHRYSFLKPIFKTIPGDILHPHQHSLQEYIQEIEKYCPKSVEHWLIKRECIFDYYALLIKT